MERKSNDEIKRWIYLLIFVLLCGLVLAGIFYLVDYLKVFFHQVISIFVPFLLAGLIIYIFHPLIEQLESKNIPRPFSILGLFLFILVGFVFIILKGTPYVIQEGKELLEQLPNISETYRQLLAQLNEQIDYLPDTFKEQVDQWIQRGEEWIASTLIELGSALTKVVDWLLLLILIPFIVFYGLKDYPLLQKVCWYVTPKRIRSEAVLLVTEMDEALGSYIRGQLIVCFIVGVIAGIGFWIIDMPYGVLLAIFIGLTNIIPYFGPILGTVPVVLLALTESIQLVFLGLIVIFAIQVIEGNALAPVIVGKSIHTHPLLIIFALLIGNGIAGLIGLILAVPILAILKVAILHLRKIIRERRGIYD